MQEGKEIFSGLRFFPGKIFLSLDKPEESVYNRKKTKRIGVFPMKLERYEWSHYWFERSGDNTDRILLVGDSITHGYGDRVRDRFGHQDGDRPVDQLTTSFSVDNPAFHKQLDLTVNDMGLQYSLIHFNNGLHGFHLSDAEYEAGYRSALELLMRSAPEAKLCLVLSTPITKADRISLQENNQIVLSRNEVVKRLAAEYGLAVDDLYSVVIGKADIKAEDGYHYTGEGYDLLADTVTQFIKKQ